MAMRLSERIKVSARHNGMLLSLRYLYTPHSETIADPQNHLLIILLEGDLPFFITLHVIHFVNIMIALYNATLLYLYSYIYQLKVIIKYFIK